MRSLKDCYTLNNGVKIPCVGYGTWRVQDGDEAVRSVSAAVGLGYRHIDTAAVYGNERGVGAAVKNCGVPRGELFVTSKVWNTERGFERALAAFDATLRDLGLDYLDLYLLHWPAARGPRDEWAALNSETWRALEKLYAEKRVRAIGVSNFLPHHLEPLLERAEVTPAVNQIEFHPGYMQRDALEFCRDKGILVEAWAPLGRGKLFSDEVISAAARRHGKTNAQICVRWCLQHSTLPLPKSVSPERMAENAAVFDFELPADGMSAIDALPNETAWSGEHPDAVQF